MNALLSRFGFRSDPFESTNAETEPLLVDYFVPPPYFPTVLGDPSAPASHVVLAPRGSGKTAQRRMIEEHSVAEGSFVCLTYANFDQPVGFQVEQADLNYHLNHICRLLLLAILFRLEENPDLVDGLTKFERGLLKFQVDRFLGTISAGEFEDSIQSIKSLGDKAGDLWHRYGGFVAAGIQLLLTRIGFNNVSIPSELVAEAKRDESLTYHFDQLVKITQSLSMGSIYVLVDKADETPLTSADSGATYALVRSLLTDLPTLEHPDVAFKFFLWDHIADEYRETGGRPDRVPIIELTWTVSELQSMLRKRLLAFSEQKVQSLNDLLCVGFAVDLDLLVAHLCQGSPRDMIRIAKSIVNEATRVTDDVECIDEEAIWNGIASFADTRAQELCPVYLPELKKVRKVTFTIKYVSSEVFHVENQSGRAKIQKWEASGVVDQVGTVPNPPNRPMHLYGITDVRVAIAALSGLEVPLILGNFVLICPRCEHIVLSDEPNCVCKDCGNEFHLDEARSLLTETQLAP